MCQALGYEVITRSPCPSRADVWAVVDGIRESPASRDVITAEHWEAVPLGIWSLTKGLPAGIRSVSSRGKTIQESRPRVCKGPVVGGHSQSGGHMGGEVGGSWWAEPAGLF